MKTMSRFGLRRGFKLSDEQVNGKQSNQSQQGQPTQSSQQSYGNSSSNSSSSSAGAAPKTPTTPRKKRNHNYHSEDEALPQLLDDQQFATCSASGSMHATSSSTVAAVSLVCSLPLERLPRLVVEKLSLLGNRQTSDGSSVSGPAGEPFTEQPDDEKRELDDYSPTAFIKVLCLYCDKKFASHKMQAKHVDKFHTERQERRCSGRNAQSNSLLLHANHSAGHAADSFPGCSYCHKSKQPLQQICLPAKHLQELFLHLAERHADKYFGCKLCTLRFQDVDQLAKHMRYIHKCGGTSETHETARESPPRSAASNTEHDDSVSPTSSERKSERRIKLRLQKSMSSCSSSNGSIIIDMGATLMGGLQTAMSTAGGKSMACHAMIGADEPVLLRLGLTQNRLPNNRSRSARLRRETKASCAISDMLLKSKHDATAATSSALAANGSGSGSGILSKPRSSSRAAQRQAQQPQPHQQPHQQPQQLPQQQLQAQQLQQLEQPNDAMFRMPTRSDVLSYVFDENFYKDVVLNVRHNLQHYLDGKLQQDASRDCLETPKESLVLGKFANQQADANDSSSSRNGFDTAIHAATNLATSTAYPTLLTAEQYGNVEAMPLAKFRRPHTKYSWKWKWDYVKKFTIINEGGKLVKKIKQPFVGLRDLSKLDMWTQLTMRQKFDVYRQAQRNLRLATAVASLSTSTAATSAALTSSEERIRDEKQRLMEQLNLILDFRLLPHIILEQNEQAIIKFENDEFGEPATAATDEHDSSMGDLMTQTFADESFLSLLQLQPRTKRPQPAQKLVLSGEWARPRCYLCICCGAKFDKLKSLEEHKIFRHSHIYSTHYEVVGRELLAGNLLRHLFIPKRALSRYDAEHSCSSPLLSSTSTSSPPPSSSFVSSAAWQHKQEERPLEEESSDSVQSLSNSSRMNLAQTPHVSRESPCSSCSLAPANTPTPTPTSMHTSADDGDTTDTKATLELQDASPMHSLPWSSGSCSPRSRAQQQLVKLEQAQRSIAIHKEQQQSQQQQSVLAASSSSSSASSASSEPASCTKCGRKCSGLMDLYRHMLDCSGDYVWSLAKKRKYRYYCGSKKRRPCNKHFSLLRKSKKGLKIMPATDAGQLSNDTEESGSNFSKTKTPPRQRPSDAESIRKMLENLPPKRVCKKIFPTDTKKARKNKNKTKLVVTGSSISMSSSSANKKIYNQHVLRTTRARQVTQAARLVRSKARTKQQQQQLKQKNRERDREREQQQQQQQLTPKKKQNPTSVGEQQQLSSTPNRSSMDASAQQTDAVTEEPKASTAPSTRSPKSQQLANADTSMDMDHEPEGSCMTRMQRRAAHDASAAMLSPIKQLMPTPPTTPAPATVTAPVTKPTVMTPTTPAAGMTMTPASGQQTSNKNLISNANVKRSKRISDCIAMLTGKLEEKLKTEQPATTGCALSSSISTSELTPTEQQEKESPPQQLQEPPQPKTPKRKAISRRIIKMDSTPPPETAAAPAAEQVAAAPTQQAAPPKPLQLAAMQPPPLAAPPEPVVSTRRTTTKAAAKQMSATPAAVRTISLAALKQYPPTMAQPVASEPTPKLIMSKGAAKAMPVTMPAAAAAAAAAAPAAAAIPLPVPTVAMPPMPVPMNLMPKLPLYLPAAAAAAAAAAAHINMPALPLPLPAPAASHLLAPALPPPPAPPPPQSAAAPVAAAPPSSPFGMEPLNLTSNRHAKKQPAVDMHSGLQQRAHLPARRQTICGFEARNMLIMDDMEPLDLSKKSAAVVLQPPPLPPVQPPPATPQAPPAVISQLSLPQELPLPLLRQDADTLLSKHFYSNLDLLKIPQVRNPVAYGQPTLAPPAATTVEPAASSSSSSTVMTATPAIAAIVPVPVKTPAKKRNAGNNKQHAAEGNAGSSKEALGKKEANAKQLAKLQPRMDEVINNHIDDAINSVILAVQASLPHDDDDERETQPTPPQPTLPQPQPQLLLQPIPAAVPVAVEPPKKAEPAATPPIFIVNTPTAGMLFSTVDELRPAQLQPATFSKNLTPKKRTMRAKTIDCRSALLLPELPLLAPCTEPASKQHSVADRPTASQPAEQQQLPSTDSAAEPISEPAAVAPLPQPMPEPEPERERDPETEPVESCPVQLATSAAPAPSVAVSVISVAPALPTVVPVKCSQQESNALADASTPALQEANCSSSLMEEHSSNLHNTSSGFHSLAQSSEHVPTVASAASAAVSEIEPETTLLSVSSDPKKKQRRRRKNELAAIVADQLLESFKIDNARRDNLKKLENLAYEKSEDLLLTGMLLMSSTKRNAAVAVPAAGNKTSEPTKRSKPDVESKTKSPPAPVTVPAAAPAPPMVVPEQAQVVATPRGRPKRRQSSYYRRGRSKAATLANENISMLKSSLESFSIGIEKQLSKAKSKANAKQSAAEPSDANGPPLAAGTVTCILRPSILTSAANELKAAQQERCLSPPTATSHSGASANAAAAPAAYSRDPRLNKNIHKDERQTASESGDAPKAMPAAECSGEEIGDLEEDNYLTEIAKNVNEKIMSAANEDFEFANDEFELDNDADNDSNSKFYSRPPTSMSVRSAPNLNDDHSNFGSMCDDNTNTEVMDMDLDDEMSVYTSYSQDLGRGGRGRRRRRRRSVLLTRRPKKRTTRSDLASEKFECLLCSKTFFTATSLSKHNMTLAHVSKLSEQEYLQSQAHEEEQESAMQSQPLPPPPLQDSPTSPDECYANVSLEAPPAPPPPPPLVSNIKQHRASVLMQSTLRRRSQSPIPSSPMSPVEQPSAMAHVITEASLRLHDNQLGMQQKRQLLPPQPENASSGGGSGGATSRLNLNPDERLFYECCNILKSAENPRINVPPSAPETALVYAAPPMPTVIVNATRKHMAEVVPLPQHYTELVDMDIESPPEPTERATPSPTPTPTASTSPSPPPASAAAPPPAAAAAVALPQPQNVSHQPVIQQNSSAVVFRNPASMHSSYNKPMMPAETNNRLSPNYSAVSQFSAATNMTTSRFKTKAAMKGYENVNMNIDLTIQRELESKSRAVCKLTELADIALGSEKPHQHDYMLPMGQLPAMQPPLPQQQQHHHHQPQQQQQHHVTAMEYAAVGTAIAPVPNAQPQPNHADVEPMPVQQRLKAAENQSSTSSKTIMHASIIKVAAASSATLRSATPPHKIIIPERPFKNIGLEEKETITFQKPKTSINLLTDDNSVSTASYSDRDDYDFGTLSCEDENSVKLSNEKLTKTHSSSSSSSSSSSEHSSNSSSSNSSRATAKTFENKSLIMGRIFKNASTKAKAGNACIGVNVAVGTASTMGSGTVKVKSIGVQKDQTPPQPKANLDQIFDELRGGGGAGGGAAATAGGIASAAGSVAGAVAVGRAKQFADYVGASSVVPTPPDSEHWHAQPIIAPSTMAATLPTDNAAMPAPPPPAPLGKKCRTTANKRATKRKPPSRTPAKAKTKANANANANDNVKPSGKLASSASGSVSASTSRKTHKDISKLQSELGMSPEEIEKLIDEGQRKSKRRCATNRPKKLVETWSSDEYEEFLSTKDIIALIEEKEQQEKRRKRKTSSNLSDEQAAASTASTITRKKSIEPREKAPSVESITATAKKAKPARNNRGERKANARPRKRNTAEQEPAKPRARPKATSKPQAEQSANELPAKAAETRPKATQKATPSKQQQPPQAKPRRKRGKDALKAVHSVQEPQAQPQQQPKASPVTMGVNERLGLPPSPSGNIYDEGVVYRSSSTRNNQRTRSGRHQATPRGDNRAALMASPTPAATPESADIDEIKITNHHHYSNNVPLASHPALPTIAPETQIATAAYGKLKRSSAAASSSNSKASTTTTTSSSTTNTTTTSTSASATTTGGSSSSGNNNNNNNNNSSSSNKNLKYKRKSQANRSSPARRKRPATEKQLYYWSSSSDEEFGRIDEAAQAEQEQEQDFDGSEQYQKHGWIVGDSHKKLVKLLAIAKGNKKVENCGVKRRTPKRKC